MLNNFVGANDGEQSQEAHEGGGAAQASDRNSE